MALACDESQGIWWFSARSRLLLLPPPPETPLSDYTLLQVQRSNSPTLGYAVSFTFSPAYH
jgi:hypothetical protein